MTHRKVSGAGNILAAVIALLMLCAASGCRSHGKIVRIAVALPLTGDLGSEGESLRRAVVLAVEQANEAKRLPFRVEVAAFDDRADPTEADNVANLIVDDPRIMAVIGHYSSDCSEHAARVYAHAPLAMISPASTNPEVTRAQLRPGWPGARVVFRLVPTDDLQGDLQRSSCAGDCARNGSPYCTTTPSTGGDWLKNSRRPSCGSEARSWRRPPLRSESAIRRR